MKVRFLAACVAVLSLLLGSDAHAQQFSHAEIQNLLDRLESAERRIGELESAPQTAHPAGYATGHANGRFGNGRFGNGRYDNGRFSNGRFSNGRFGDGPSGVGAGLGYGPGKEANSKPTFIMNGRIHADYWGFGDSSPGIGFFEHSDPAEANYGTDPEDRVFFRRIRLEMKGDLYENMLYRVQIDFNNPARAEMKDIFIGWKNLAGIGTVLVGNQKRPIGMDHLNSSRRNIFIERPLVVEAFNEDARRFGIAAYNNTDDLRYTWAYGIYALENMATDGRIHGDSMQLSGNARLASSPWYDETSGGRGYFHWAVSGMVARPDGDNSPADTNANDGRFRTRAELRSDSRWIDTGRIAGADWYEIVGVESVLNIGALHIVSEYQSNWMQRDNTTAGTGPDLNFHGGYVSVAYMLTGEHMPLNRKSGTLDRVIPFENFFLVDTCNGGTGRGMGAWQIAARYSFLDLSDHDVLGGVQRNGTAALVWYFNPHSSLQFNAIYGDIEEHAAVGGYTDGHFTAYGTQLRVEF